MDDGKIGNMVPAGSLLHKIQEARIVFYFFTIVAGLFHPRGIRSDGVVCFVAIGW